MAVADILQITTACSAKCSHCLFAQPNMPQLHLSPKQVMKISLASNKIPLIWTGGEPWEHPKIHQLLRQARGISRPFRIATGNFTDTNFIIKHLKKLTNQSPGFLGLSLGTDVILERNINNELKHQWIKNIALFNKHQIPYSLTFTWSPSFLQNTRVIEPSWELRPQFIYLRVSKQDSSTIAEDWITRCIIDRLEIPDITIITDTFETAEKRGRNVKSNDAQVAPPPLSWNS